MIENMRYMLYPLSPDYPIAFGNKLHTENGTIYFSGGSGYVMSKAALINLVEKQFLKGSPCYKYKTGNEDVNVGTYLQSYPLSFL